MKTHKLLVAAIASVIAHLGMAAPALSVSTRTCLFLDDRFISKQSGFQRVWHQGIPFSEPAITGRWPCLFGSVLYDPEQRIYKMYYEEFPETRGSISYAESRDGKTWSKPNLGLFEINGSRANNCVWTGATLPNVFLDPLERDPQRRFKMFIWSEQFEARGIFFRGHVLLSSADGIHWEPRAQIALPDPVGDSGAGRSTRDAQEITWDPLRQRYLGTFRTFPSHPGLPGFFRDEEHPNRDSQYYGIGGHRRAVAVSTSPRLPGRWAPLVDVLKTDAIDDEKATKLSRDPSIADYVELYVMPTFIYGNHYIGMVSLLFQVDGSDTKAGAGDLQLTFSHDGMKWNRHPERQTLVAPARRDLVPCYAQCNEPLDMGDHMLIYYTEATAAHFARYLKGGNNLEFLEENECLIRAARWRKDGFVSLECSQPSTLTTVPLSLEGNAIEVNLCTTGNSRFNVAILDDEGKELAGYGLSDCIPVTGDAVAQRISWRNGLDLSSLQGRPVRLRFSLGAGKLWSFRFAR